MIRVEVKTRLSMKEAIERAVRFFGPQGLGLEIKDRDACEIWMEGGGGAVAVYACKQGRDTRVEVMAREWEAQVPRFVSQLDK